MKRSSLLKHSANPAGVLLLAAAALGLSAPQFAYAQGNSPTIQLGSGPAATVPAPPKLNPTNHPITLTIPAMDGTIYIGDIILTIEPNDRIEFSSQRTIELLSRLLTDAAQQNLRAKFSGKAVVTPADFEDTGIGASYNAQNLQLVFAIPPELKAAQALAVAPRGEIIGTFEKPASLSAYMNINSSLDYVEQGGKTGFQNPIFLFDGAAFSHGVELESQGIWQPGNSGTSYQRQGTRLIYDDIGNIVRWTAGDLQTVSQGFQASPDMAGLSVYRSYSILQPEVSVRPSGDQSFRLLRPSSVTISVNGAPVRTLRLDPGTYNLRSFPFSQGANDITVFIQDDTGAQQTLHFSVFFDQTQLAPGISEFGLWGGVNAPLEAGGPHYTNELQITGFYRRGITQELTLGVNFQANKDTKQYGAQALWGSPIGTFGLDVAGSHVHGFGDGYAATLTYQRLFEFVGGQGDSLNLAVTTRSKNFGQLTAFTPFTPISTNVPPTIPPVSTPPPTATSSAFFIGNPYKWELSGGYTHAFNEDLYGSLTAHYSKGRDANPNVHDYHAILGYRVTPEIGVTFDVGYQQGTGFESGWGGLISLTWSLTPTSSSTGSFNTRDNDARLSYQNVTGTGVGSYNVAINGERSDIGSGVDGTVNYIANRAQLGLSHFTSFTGALDHVTDQRTSAHVSTALAFADGAVSVGRPVSQAFAIVTKHRSLQNADVIVNPTPQSYTAETGSLGTALESDLTSYVPRTLTVDSPDAPPGYDLGTGSFRVFPPYRAGYRLQVGSDYSVTAIGSLLTAHGDPLTLIAGKAIEVANPTREPIAIFTNGQGRFGIAGLKPGRWRIEMPTEPMTTYYLDIPDNAVGVVRAGDLKPSETGN